MKATHHAHTEVASRTPQHPVPARAAYRTPRLTAYGDLRGITLGGSPGATDSGNTMMEDIFLFSRGYHQIP